MKKRLFLFQQVLKDVLVERNQRIVIRLQNVKTWSLSFWQANICPYDRCPEFQQKYIYPLPQKVLCGVTVKNGQIKANLSNSTTNTRNHVLPRINSINYTRSISIIRVSPNVTNANCSFFSRSYFFEGCGFLWCPVSLPEYKPVNEFTYLLGN